MSKEVLLFAPCAFNLAETSRMVEIAKGVRHHPEASQVFDVHFISDGGEFEQMIERHGFPLTRLEPRLTPEKIEHIAKVDRGEKFAPAFTDREMIERVENETACLKNLTPVAVVTGSYVTIPVTCRVLQIPLVWVVQSTWLPDFFCHGAGMTDHIRPTPIKALLDWFILRFINFWIRYVMRRYERASTMLTSNRPVEDWGKLLGDAAAVSAMLDRLLHHGHVLKCGPRSWRTKTDLPPQEAAG